MRKSQLKKTHMFLQLRRPKNFRLRLDTHHPPTPSPNAKHVVRAARVSPNYFLCTIFFDRIHIHMSLDQIPVGFIRFGYFGAHLSSKWYSPSFHASSPHGLVDDLDADICIPGATEARHIHMASSQVLLVKSASRFVALAGCIWQNSCSGTRFSLSSFTSPARSRFPWRISQRAATSVKTTFDMYLYCCHRIAPARASLALAR